MALVTIDAVVDVARDALMLEIVGVVTAVTTGALEDGVVIRVDVAGGANVIRVAVTGWKWRVLGVIERRTRPGTRVMAVLASSREELRLRRMAGVCAGVVIRLVTADTRGRQRRVVVVDVAIRALTRWHGVRAGQRKTSTRMVKLAMRPEHRIMAACAGRRKSGMGNRSRCASIIFLVA